MATADLRSVYEGRRVCVTGGAGFIGSHLVDALVDLGAAVMVLDDLSTGSLDNLESVGGKVGVVEGSILDPAAVLETVGRAQIVFHQAALTSVPGSVEDPTRYHEVNATGTLRILDAARLGPAANEGGCRIVFAASSSAYGSNETDPLDESLPPQPLSPYAVAKITGEMLMRAFSLCYGISTVSLRYFNIFGPRQSPDSPYAAVIPLFARSMLQGERPVVFGDGSQTRDFTHVSNAVHANLLAGATDSPLVGQVVNVACGASIDLLTLLDRIAAIAGTTPQHDSQPPRIGDVMHSRADISVARDLLGYEPVTSLEAGLADAMTYYSTLYAQA
jgi:UDP-glucose 4-epimerase